MRVLTGNGKRVTIYVYEVFIQTFLNEWFSANILLRVDAAKRTVACCVEQKARGRFENDLRVPIKNRIENNSKRMNKNE